MRKILRERKGFTLIELIIVIVILGVLAGIAAPRMIGSIKSSKISAAVSNIKIIEKAAVTLFTQQSGATAPTAAEIMDAVDQVPAGYTVTACALVGSGANTQLDITMTIDEDTAGVVLADVSPFATGGANATLGGVFTEAGTTLTYRNQTLQ